MSWGISIIDLINNKKTELPKVNKIPVKGNKKLYYKLVWIHTERNAKYLPYYKDRGWDKKHIDHIVPIHYGFKHSILPQLIGSLINLRMLDKNNNMRKNSRLTEESHKILNRWK